MADGELLKTVNEVRTAGVKDEVHDGAIVDTIHRVTAINKLICE
jgi:hypothetical protein